MNNEKQKNIKEKLKYTVESKTFKIVMYSVGTLVVVCMIFQVGVVVGFGKATYGSNWHNNYISNFGPIHRPRLIMSVPENLPNAHGAIGKIIKSDYPIIIVEDQDKSEKVVIVNDTTDIRKFRTDGTRDDLTVDTFVVVIGSPNESGQVEAKLIRILPQPQAPDISH
jgi:hypothetical protein